MLYPLDLSKMECRISNKEAAKEIMKIRNWMNTPRYLLLRGNTYANELPPGCEAALSNKQLLINEEIFSGFTMFFPVKTKYSHLRVPPAAGCEGFSSAKPERTDTCWSLSTHPGHTGELRLTSVYTKEP